jgi:hypothetical protein
LGAFSFEVSKNFVRKHPSLDLGQLQQGGMLGQTDYTSTKHLSGAIMTEPLGNRRNCLFRVTSDSQKKDRKCE